MRGLFQSFVVGCFLVSSLTLPAEALGDRWGAPAREHLSENEKWSLVVGFKGGKTLSLCQRTSDGLTETWRRGYVHRVWPPHHAYVTNDGNYIVLRDVYHNIGRGNVIVILGENGKVLGSYELNEFLSEDEILRAPRSVSSLWWSERAWISLVDSDRKFAIVTRLGTVCCFDLATGKLLELGDDRMVETLAYLRQRATQWQKSDDMSVRIRGLLCKASMGDVDVLRTAKDLLGDADAFAEERLAAASALTRLIHLDAIPIIEKQLGVADRRMRKELLGVLEKFDASAFGIFKTDDSVALKQMWVRLTGHALDDVSETAILEVLLRDDGTYLAAHPELIEHRSDAVRASVIRNWGATESPEAGLAFRKGILDAKASIRLLSLQCLVAREPSDTETLLLRFLGAEYRWARQYALVQLASRGHPAARRKLKAAIPTWVSFDREGESSGELIMDIETLCKLIADLKLDGVSESLAEIRTVQDPWVSAYVNGALAALGDQQATVTLHRIANDEKSAVRGFAIEMCRYQTDLGSAGIVQKAVTSKQHDIRSAATKKLTRFKDKRSP